MLDPRDLELTSHLVQGQRIVGTQLLPSPLRNAHLPLQAPSLGMAARRQTHSSPSFLLPFPQPSTDGRREAQGGKGTVRDRVRT